MSLQILINNSTDPRSDYITWTPTPCSIESDEPAARTVVLRNKNTTRGGQIVFFDGPPFNPANQIQLNVPANGSVQFFIGGRFDLQTGRSFPSIDDKDAIIQISDNNGTVGEKTLMVRIRKNANGLTPGERDRFLDAIVKLNQAGSYVDLQNMHINANSSEIHFRSCFLPWHRAFLIDLERKLQEITPSVTIPYWESDKAAPRIFHRDFMGVPDSTGMVSFSASNPLINWQLQLFGMGNGTRIRRVFDPGFNPATTRMPTIQNDEAQTLNLGNVFSVFARQPANQADLGGIESDPHGSTHGSFDGQVGSIGRAPADPLFFLIHCNIDRLWAKWQWVNEMSQPNDSDAYPRQGNGDPARTGERGIGNFTNDSMWPWNGTSGAPRPPHSPSNGLPGSPLTNFPGTQPTVAEMIDYKGQVSLSNNLHFAYQDVPYEF